ncbi:CAP domain-containing protein, partial [Yinghuangia seranimata]|uniref:CAP domain-containing protein n=1 Tax=Yinghuangia seranimata TaxID=408067 RepID=UPI00248B10CF
ATGVGGASTAGGVAGAHAAGAAAGTAGSGAAASGAAGAGATTAATTAATGTAAATTAAVTAGPVLLGVAAVAAVAVLLVVWLRPHDGSDTPPPPAAPTSVAAAAPAAVPSVADTPSESPSPSPSTVPPSPTESPSPSPTPDRAAVLERQLVDLVNAERAKSGCQPLRIDPKVHAAAQRHADDMVARGFYDHTSPDGRGPGERVTAAGYRWSAWAENLDRGRSTAAAVVKDWMDRSIHQQNMLDCNLKDTGVGIAQGPGGLMWVQDLATH